jgi:hypothetical protein
MASVFLKARELNGRELPEVCIVCGRPGRLKKVHLRDSSGLFLNLSPGVNIITHTDTTLPLCPEHQGYFDQDLRAVALVLGGVLLLLALGAILGFLVSFFAFIGVFLLAVFAVMVLGVIRHIRLHSGAHACEIMDRGICMDHVSEEFADALDDLREGIVATGDEGPRSKRKRRSRAGVPVWVWLLGGGAVLVVMVFCGSLALVFQLLSTPPPDSPAATNAAGTIPAATDPTGEGEVKPVVRTITDANVRRLRVGMPVAEVVEILGPPREEIADEVRWYEDLNFVVIHQKDGHVTMIFTLVDGRRFNLPEGY